MAHTRDYGLEPETRAPQQNNVRLKGALCKHLLSVVDLIKSGELYEQMAKDVYNWLRYNRGDTYKFFSKGRLMHQAKTKKNKIDWEKNTSYMNDYLATKAGIAKFLDKNNINKSLEQEIDRTKRSFSNITLDEFLQDEFGESLSDMSETLGISEEGVRSYFKSLGLE